MGEKLKPVDAFVQLIYRCPECGGNIWITKEEAQVPGFKVVCCSKAFELQTIRNLTLQCQYVAKPVIKKPTAEGSVSMGAPTQAIEVLRNVGYQKAEATGLVIKATKRIGNNKSVEELVKHALAEDDQDD